MWDMDQFLTSLAPSSLVGFVAGLLLGGVLVGLWVTSRLRPHAQRAEATAEELRKQVDQERTVTGSLRNELAAVQQARVAAETRMEDAARQLEEQKALIDHTRHELIGSFQALSGEALKEAISSRIKGKKDNLVGDMASQALLVSS